MKQTNVKRTLSFVMSLILVLVFTVSAGASAPNETYAGTIVIDENSSTVDLSDIEVQVFSAEPIYDAETQKLLYYGEAYAFSVYTNENGEFSFVKPTEFCSVTISLESLPVGYGIGQKVQFIVSGVTHHTYVLSEVAEVDIQMENEQVNVFFYDKDADILHVDYQIEMDPVSMESFSTKQLNGMKSYNLMGVVRTPEEETAFTFSVDLSKHSLLDKIDYLYTKEFVSEEKKIDVYCDILLDSSLGVKLGSGTVIVNTILDYQNETSAKVRNDSRLRSINGDTVKSSLSIEKISKVSKLYATSSSEYSTYVQRTMEDGFTFRVFYDSSSPANLTQYDAGFLADDFEDAYRYFVIERGFNAPIPDSGSYYKIILEVDFNQSEMHGYTSNSTASTPGGSYMWFNDRTTNTLTVAHELHHAIMTTYGFDFSQGNRWITEGYASMASLIYYSFSGDWFAKKIASYLSKSEISMFNISNDPYGAMMYPLYIYEYLGGWNTIKQIYTNYSSTGNIYTAISNASYISSYRYAFVGMFSQNYKPSAFYTSLSSLSNQELNMVDESIPLQKSTIDKTFLVTSNPMAGCYRQYESAGYIGRIMIDCNILSGSGSGFFIDKITESGNGAPYIESVSDNFTKIAFYQNNFGGPGSKLTIVAINTNTSGSAIRCEFNVSVPNQT